MQVLQNDAFVVDVESFRNWKVNSDAPEGPTTEDRLLPTLRVQNPSEGSRQPRSGLQVVSARTLKLQAPAKRVEKLRAAGPHTVWATAARSIHHSVDQKRRQKGARPDEGGDDKNHEHPVEESADLER